MASPDPSSLSDYQLKVVIVGDKGVGKTCLMLRFTDDSYDDAYKVTIGVDIKVRTLELSGHLVKLQIWDTAGEERFRTLSSQYYRGSHGIIIVYDITNVRSFENVSTWLSDINRYVDTDVKRLLVGNKSDCHQLREVAYESGRALASNLHMDFMETSAKQYHNVDEAFLKMAQNILMLDERRLRDEEANRIRITNTRTVASGGWCCSNLA